MWFKSIQQETEDNTGLGLDLEPEYEGDYEDWDTMIDTNIKELLTMTRLIVPQMSHGFREIFSRFFVVNQLLPMSNVQKQQFND